MPEGDDAVNLAPRRAESARAARRLVQGLDLDHSRLLVPGDDHLGDALAALDQERLLTVVDQDNPHLAAIVAVDRAGRVRL